MKDLVLFNDYMKQFEREDTPRGDLALDMRDKPMPALYKYRERLRFLIDHCACRECVETYKECWEEYKQTHQSDIRRLYRIRRYMAKNNIGMVELIVMDAEKRLKGGRK